MDQGPNPKGQAPKNFNLRRPELGFGAFFELVFCLLGFFCPLTAAWASLE
jgi:hypothetical protein